MSYFRLCTLWWITCWGLTAALPASAQSWSSHAPSSQHGGMQRVLLGHALLQGLSPEFMATSLRRRHLSSANQLECTALDSHMPILKRNVRRAAPEAREQALSVLQNARARYGELRC